MHLVRSEAYIDEQDFAIVGFRESGGQSRSESGCSRCFRKTSNRHKLRFMGQIVKLEVETQTVADRLRVRPKKVIKIPRRQICRNRFRNNRAHFPIWPGS